MGGSHNVTGGEHNRWERRSVASTVLRILVLTVPIGASVVTGIAVGGRLPATHGWVGLVGQLAVVLAASTIVLLLVDRYARRLLPLAALLRLSLVFPDKAPSRIGVAVRSRNLRSLRSWAEEAAKGHREPDDAQHATDVLTLATALGAHDRRTRGHSERVRSLTMLVAKEMGIEGEHAERLQWAALLHDIGKLTVPPEILNKKGAPDDRELKILQSHPASGAQIAGPLADWLGEDIAAVGQHHERWDGNGYPDGLAGDEIGLAARIVAVTDSFETMTAVRSYKKAMKPAAAREELAGCSGSHFDPSVVRAFMRLSIGRLTWTVGIASWVAQLPFVGMLPRASAGVAEVFSAAPGVSTAVAGAAAVALGLSVSPPASPAHTPGARASASLSTKAGEHWNGQDTSGHGLDTPGDAVAPPANPTDAPVASPPDDALGDPTPTTPPPGAAGTTPGNSGGNAAGDPPSSPGQGKGTPPADPTPGNGTGDPPMSPAGVPGLGNPGGVGEGSPAADPQREAG